MNGLSDRDMLRLSAENENLRAQVAAEKERTDAVIAALKKGWSLSIQARHELAEEIARLNTEIRQLTPGPWFTTQGLTGLDGIAEYIEKLQALCGCHLIRAEKAETEISRLKAAYGRI